jgi:cell division protein FtsZ
MIEFDSKNSPAGSVIKIIGVGGAGGNAVNTMIENNLNGVEFVVANTDTMDLHKSKAKIKLQLGKKTTRGLGTGANPEIGREAANESIDEIRSTLEGADMVFLAAGMGGGTGSGAAPVIAQLAREMKILSLGIVTKPFRFEGQKRKENSDLAIQEFSQFVDTLIVIPNEKIREIYSDITVLNAFHQADNILYEAAKAVSDIINFSGYMNVDFADVKKVMSQMGYALMGTGIAEGENRAVIAAKSAISNPLLSDINLQGCKALLINITAGSDLLMSEFDTVSEVVVNETGSSANTILGLVFDDKMQGKIGVTIIATGLQSMDEDNISFGPVITTKPLEVPSSNELDDILERIQANQMKPAETTLSENASEDLSSYSPTIQTDIPSFLKAMD